MTLGILKEAEGEQRVALTPESVPALIKLGIQEVWIEKGAGERAFFSDQAYEQQGARVGSRADILKQTKIVVCISAPPDNDLAALSTGQVLIGQFNPLGSTAFIDSSVKNKATTFSLDLVPRTTRAQAMDVLSSMATVAGYKAVLTAANHLPTFFPMFMTAAGTIKPAKVLILGAGVAGLQAIATAKRLGASVEAFDVRAAAKEEVMSLETKFVEVEGARDEKAAGGYAVEQTDEYKAKQAEIIHKHAVAADVVICTAQIPGRRAPVLLRKETVEQMKAGAVIVDLAASSGGNCEVTQNNQTIQHNGVSVIGNSALPATAPKDASTMFGKNVVNFAKILIIKGELTVNFEDDILLGSCVAHDGDIISPRLKPAPANA